ncbi:hypothetical protein BJX65DRAFT_156971 [Aspergillus insuetus]
MSSLLHCIVINSCLQSFLPLTCMTFRTAFFFFPHSGYPATWRWSSTETLHAGLIFELYFDIHGDVYNGWLLSSKNGVLHRVYT